eukprot:m.82181 g.82181  ORF g.82181 m.82181 type:complete len:711 (-) comp9450_c0_seq1:323-2455(-)
MAADEYDEMSVWGFVEEPSPYDRNSSEPALVVISSDDDDTLYQDGQASPPYQLPYSSPHDRETSPRTYRWSRTDAARALTRATERRNLHAAAAAARHTSSHAAASTAAASSSSSSGPLPNASSPSATMAVPENLNGSPQPLRTTEASATQTATGRAGKSRRRQRNASSARAGKRSSSAASSASSSSTETPITGGAATASAAAATSASGEASGPAATTTAAAQGFGDGEPAMTDPTIGVCFSSTSGNLWKRRAARGFFQLSAAAEGMGVGFSRRNSTEGGGANACPPSPLSQLRSASDPPSAHTGPPSTPSPTATAAAAEPGAAMVSEARLTMSPSQDTRSSGPPCVICCDSMAGELAAITCGHVFHRACILRWFTFSPSCPSCKVGVVLDHYHQPRQSHGCIDLFFECGSADAGSASSAAVASDSHLATALASAKETIAELIDRSNAVAKERAEALSKNQDLETQLAQAASRLSAMTNVTKEVARHRRQVGKLEKDLKDARLDRLAKARELESLRDVMRITQGHAVDDRTDDLYVSEATVNHLKMTTRIYRDSLQKQQREKNQVEHDLNVLQQKYDALSAVERRQGRELTNLRERLRTREVMYNELERDYEELESLKAEVEQSVAATKKHAQSPQSARPRALRDVQVSPSVGGAYPTIRPAVKKKGRVHSHFMSNAKRPKTSDTTPAPVFHNGKKPVRLPSPSREDVRLA